MRFRFLAIACLCACAHAAEPSWWVVVQDSHFEVYSQSEAEARDALGKLEWLRVLAERQVGWSPAAAHRVRVIGFRSEDEYEAYRPKPLSDGYYAGSQSRDYIVVPALDAAHDGALAHEYAHALIHRIGLTPPVWLNEGFAEVFSAAAGPSGDDRGDVAARLQLLRRRPWLPLSEIVSLAANSPVLDHRESAEMFYAQSWALTEMLVRSPAYAPRFASLLAEVGAGAAGGRTLETIYGKPLDAIASDMGSWIGERPHNPLPAAAAPAAPAAVEARPVTAFAMKLVLANVLVTSQQLDRAEALYDQLARDAPNRPEAYAGLGVIAMARGDTEAARRWWKRALELGLADGDICYRYVALLDGAGVTGAELRAALERTLALRPDLDDARWRLALLEESEGHDRTSLAQLHAMKAIAPNRAQAYWCVTADAELGLGRSDEASLAAAKALALATTEEERARAARIQYTAQTHLDVQLRSDSNGRPEMVTTRVPNNAADWNPFIEPGDDIHRVSGTLQQVDCTANGIRITVRLTSGPLRLTIPDPTRVRILRGPAEFTCGAQTPAAVTVEYAMRQSSTDGVVRGIEFQK
ncbi:MAG: tetratricopeptide repeat protein [Bryobacteraceae bacterium]